MKTKLLVTVSGGRSSGYMAIHLFNLYQSEYDMHFVFANTGEEHEATLEFVKNIEKYFGLPIVWIEAVVENQGISSTHKIVTYETASRRGEPFEEVIKKYGLPNQNFLHCTRELKINPITHYMKQHGILTRTLGIRYDEEHRYTPREGLYYPLYDWKSTKKSINLWWSKQNFDLEIPDYLGNCKTCHKKSDKKINLIAVEHPEYFDFYKRMETTYPDTRRNIFRGERTAQDVLDGKVYDLFNFDTCPEECGTVIPMEDNNM